MRLYNGQVLHTACGDDWMTVELDGEILASFELVDGRLRVLVFDDPEREEPSDVIGLSRYLKENMRQ